MAYTKNGVPTWAKANAPGTGQGETIREQNERLFLSLEEKKPEYLPNVFVDGLSKDKGDVTIIYDLDGEVFIVTIQQNGNAVDCKLS